MLYLNGEKVSIFKFTKGLGPRVASYKLQICKSQERSDPQSPQSATFAEGPQIEQIIKSKKLFKSANLRVCDLCNLFALDLALYAVIPFQVQ